MKINWYQNLYMGEKARKKKKKIIQGIRDKKIQINNYVITPAVNGNNILDIYQASILLSPYMQEETIFIIGIAGDYYEALQVAGTIVHELYQKTGGFELPDLIGNFK